MMVTLKGKTNINIISAYAPPSNAPETEKESFYVSFTTLIRRLKNHDVTIIGGDFNAKLIELNEEEQKIFGKHYLKAAPGTLETHL